MYACVCARARESRLETVYPRAYKPRVRVLYSRNGLRSSSSSSSLPLPSLCLPSTFLLFVTCGCLFLSVSQSFSQRALSFARSSPSPRFVMLRRLSLSFVFCPSSSFPSKHLVRSSLCGKLAIPIASLFQRFLPPR